MFPKLDVKKFHITNDEQFALDLLRDKKNPAHPWRRLPLGAA